MANFSVNILGCGSAKPGPLHQPSCTVLNVRDALYMVDCGEGAQRGMPRMGLKMNRLNHIFLTHLHGDHVFGLPGLLSTMGLLERQGFITIHTFAAGIKILREMLDFFCPELPFEVKFHEISPHGREVVLDNKTLTVRTIPLIHRVDCVGYIFEEKPGLPHLDREAADWHGVPRAMYERIKHGEPYIKADGTEIPASMLTRPATPAVSYAHIGDTAFNPGIAEEIGPVNLLYHESTYLHDMKALAHKRGHSTAEQAARMALKSGAKRLLLGHYSSRYKDDSLFEKEAQEIFPSSIAGHEGLTINL